MPTIKPACEENRFPLRQRKGKAKHMCAPRKVQEMAAVWWELRRSNLNKEGMDQKETLSDNY